MGTSLDVLNSVASRDQQIPSGNSLDVLKDVNQNGPPSSLPPIRTNERGFMERVARGGAAGMAEAVTGAAKLGSAIPGVDYVAGKVGDVLGLPKLGEGADAATQVQQAIQPSIEQDTSTLAGKAGYGLEGIAEFVMGDEALKGLSVAKKLGLASKVAKLAEEYPTLGKMIGSFVKNTALGTGQAALHGADTEQALESGVTAGATGAALEGVAAGVGKIAPKFKELAGEKIPVRASAESPVAGVAEYAGSSGDLKKFDVEKTGPAARKAVSKLATTAAGEADTAATPIEDSFGLRKTADKLFNRARPVFDKLDELSEGEEYTFKDLQDLARKAAATKDYKDVRYYRGLQEDMFQRYAGEFEGDTLAKAKADWKQGIGMDDLGIRLNRAVHATPVELAKAGEPDLGYINGKQLREAIVDGLQKTDKSGLNEFEKAGFSPEHIQTIQDISRLLEKGNNLHKLNPIMKLVAHGGYGVIGMLGHPVASGTLLGTEYAVSKAMGRILTDPAAARTLQQILRSSVTPGAAANTLRPFLKETKEENPSEESDQPESSQVNPKPAAKVEGMLEPGNIDLSNRPVIQNQGGSHSTEYSVSMQDDKGREVLVPTVVNGKFLTPDGKKPPEKSEAEKKMFQRAWKHYQDTGEHMGIFDTPEHANAYANVVHNRKMKGSNESQ